MINILKAIAEPCCLASTRRGKLCQSPAMPNGRCRVHGGSNPGAPIGNQNALKHGRYSAKTRDMKKAVRFLLDAIG